MADEQPTDEQVQAWVDETVDKAADEGNKTAQQMQELRAKERAKTARAIQKASKKGRG